MMAMAIKHGPLHFVRCLADHLAGSYGGVNCPGVFAGTWRWLRCRTMFSTMTTAPSTTIPKSSAPSESRFAGMPFRFRQVAANNSENGIVRATIIAPRTFPRNRKGRSPPE